MSNKVNTVNVQLGWPPVYVSERDETRGDHLTALVGMLAVAGYALWLPAEFSGVFAAVSAFIAGSAFQNWVSWDDE